MNRVFHCFNVIQYIKYVILLNFNVLNYVFDSLDNYVVLKISKSFVSLNERINNYNKK